MAQKTTVVKSSDLSGEEGNDIVTVTLSHNGRTGEIDLTPKEADELDDTLAVYFDNGRKAVAVQPVKRVGVRRVGTVDREQSQAVRAWARLNGWPELGNRGRVPNAISEAFEAAH